MVGVAGGEGKDEGREEKRSDGGGARSADKEEKSS